MHLPQRWFPSLNRDRSVSLGLPTLSRFALLERALIAAGVFLLLAAIALPFDLASSRTLRGDWIGGDLKRLILLAEVYAHGTGVAMILITIAVLDPKARRSVLRLGCCAFGAGMLANVAKMYVARIRPHSLPDGATLADSFVGFFPALGDIDQTYGHALQSMPSAHTATAIGLTIGLVKAYPHGRWLFVTFAALAALQRVVVGAHYLSDVFCGAALATIFASVLVDARLLGAWFDRLEIARSNVTDDESRSAAA